MNITTRLAQLGKHDDLSNLRTLNEISEIASCTVASAKNTQIDSIGDKAVDGLHLMGYMYVHTLENVQKVGENRKLGVCLGR